ncbi:hypothetical protein Ae201684_012312 [Aphanomyces euteiches]|uniref:histone acetyltransferase n=2 Tax=Aphanomyces euteiches TaxID=100861 RepID=A0A6G0WS93_9STRA|nr:hypothetical protein Ae201684_012312 [Aphanomyces euteiches]KAH9135635.1 hypothetical protein AeRB84_019011 [Aphanomyces euteiches]
MMGSTLSIMKGDVSSPDVDLVTEMPSAYLRQHKVLECAESYDFAANTTENATYLNGHRAHSPHRGENPKKRKRHEKSIIPFVMRNASDVHIRRPSQYNTLFVAQKERYWNITPSSVHFLVERSLEFLGNKNRRNNTTTVIVRYMLWRQYTTLLEAQRVCERRLRAARLSDQSSGVLSISPDSSSNSTDEQDRHAPWSRARLPRNTAESIVLDKLKLTFKCSSIKRDDQSSRKLKKREPSSSQTIVSNKPYFADTTAPFYSEKAERVKPVDPRRRFLSRPVDASPTESSSSTSSKNDKPVDPRRRLEPKPQPPPPSPIKLYSKKKSPLPVQSYEDYLQSVSPMKLKKRSRSDPSLRGTTTSPRKAKASSNSRAPPPHIHVTGAQRSLPENWKRRKLPHGIKPIKPFDGMSVEQIEEHLRSLKVEGRLKKFRRFSVLLQKLMEHPRNCNGVFNSPVDPVAMNLPTYFTVISHPMDLGTIKKRMDSASYDTPDAFADDIRLVFENAMKFNNNNHWVHVNASILLNYFHECWAVDFEKTLLEETKASSHSCDVCYGQVCVACDQGCLELTVPFNQCFGNCGTTFRKGNTYFVTRDGTRMWCTKCRNKSVKEERILREDDECFGNPLLSRRNTMPTASEVEAWLVKTKCEVDVEPWVKCSVCELWMHQICVLFNPVEDAYDTANHFVCPHCQLKSRRLSSIPPSFLDCTSLPESELSQFLEARLADAAGDAVDSLCVRTMTFAAHESTLPNDVVEMFQFNARTLRQGYPDSGHLAVDVPNTLVHGTKTIFLFQKQHGVDVCLFAMYVQEYNDAVEYAPNRRSVYLAYIDSVRYMEPASIRTAVYHSILVSYFDYVRRRGFERVYIWSCPPQRSQSYVFWCHPLFQKTPGVEHLRLWYKRVLDAAQRRGIVAKWGSLYDRHFATVAEQLKKNAQKTDGNVILLSKQAASVATRRGSSSTCLVDKEMLLWPVQVPLFDGDFIPGELERIVRSLKAKNKPRRDTGSSEPIYLRDAFSAFVTAIKAMKDDLLEVDLAPLQGPPIAARDPPTKLPPFVGSRFAYHQMSSYASYQFDSLRRAKHSTMMLLHQMINANVPQCNSFCAECALLITHADHWFCRTCSHFALCDWCHAHHGPEHMHTLYRGLDDMEGS